MENIRKDEIGDGDSSVACGTECSVRMAQVSERKKDLCPLNAAYFIEFNRISILAQSLGMSMQTFEFLANKGVVFGLTAEQTEFNDGLELLKLNAEAESLNCPVRSGGEPNLRSTDSISEDIQEYVDRYRTACGYSD